MMMTDEKLSETRMSICQGCDRYSQRWKMCKECGCFMPVKTLLADMKCPKGKW